MSRPQQRIKLNRELMGSFVGSATNIPIPTLSDLDYMPEGDVVRANELINRLALDVGALEEIIRLAMYRNPKRRQ